MPPRAGVSGERDLYHLKAIVDAYTAAEYDWVCRESPWKTEKKSPVDLVWGDTVPRIRQATLDTDFAIVIAKARGTDGVPELSKQMIRWSVEKRRDDCVRSWFRAITRALRDARLTDTRAAAYLTFLADQGARPSGSEEWSLWCCAAAGIDGSFPGGDAMLGVLKERFPPKNAAHLMKMFSNTVPRLHSPEKTARCMRAAMWIDALRARPSRALRSSPISGL